MEDALTIGRRLKEEALKAQERNDTDVSWQILRSEVYARDHGICWICHEFIYLNEYDCGHLVDRSMGGLDIDENLAPMHKLCNLSKPKHRTLEEAVIWQLRIKRQQETAPTMFTGTPNNNHHTHKNNHRKPKIKNQLSMIDLEKNNAIFQSSPVLQNTSDIIKLEVIKLLGRILDTPDMSKINLPQQIQPNIGITKPQILLQSQMQMHPETRRANTYHLRKRAVRQPVVRPPKPIPQELLDKMKPGTVCWIQGRPIGGAMWKVLPPPYSQDILFTVRSTPPGAIDNGLGGIQQTIQVIGGDLTQEVKISMGHVDIYIHPNGTRQPSITFSSNTSANNASNRSQTVGFGIGQIPIKEWRQAKAQGISFNEFKSTYYNKANSPSFNPMIKQVFE